MKINRAFSIVTIALFILIGCVSVSAQDIRYNFLPGTDFSKYRTYKWVRVPKAEYPNQILDSQIMQAIDAQLALKGLTKNEDNPDLYVAYQAAVNRRNSGTRTVRTWAAGAMAVGAAGAAMAAGCQPRPPRVKQSILGR